MPERVLPSDSPASLEEKIVEQKEKVKLLLSCLFVLFQICLFIYIIVYAISSFVL